MRSAPPVALVCDGGAGWRGLQALLYGLAMATFVAWVTWHAGTGPAGMAAAVSMSSTVTVTWAWRVLQHRPQNLAWDGERWTAGPRGGAGQVEVMIDIGAWLLLRFTPVDSSGPARWLAVSAAAAGASLHPLRSALFGGVLQAATVDGRSPERQPV